MLPPYKAVIRIDFLRDFLAHLDMSGPSRVALPFKRSADFCSFSLVEAQGRGVFFYPNAMPGVTFRPLLWYLNGKEDILNGESKGYLFNLSGKG